MIVLPPTAPDAEAGALGCILLDPDQVIPKARQVLTTHQMFHDERNQQIFRTALAMNSAGQSIDLITFSQRLQDEKKLDDIGGRGYLAALQDTTPSPANFSYYADILIEKYRLRELLERANEITEMVARSQSAAEIFARWSDVAVELSGAAPSKSIKELATEAYDDLMASAERVQKGGAIGLNIGIRSVDQKTRGLMSKELVILAARPGLGKTSALLSVARNIALAGGPVAYLSFESDTDELTKRLIGIESMIDQQRPELWDEADHLLLNQSSTRIGKLQIHMRFLPDARIDQVCALAIALNNQHGLKALLLDSLGMIPGTRDHYQDKDRVNEVVAYLHRLKSKLNIPIIAAHHLNREAETEKRPKLRHLGQTGDVEKYANVVVFLHQPGADQNKLHLPTVSASWIVEKRRGGETGDCDAQFRRYCGRWEDLPLDHANS